MAASVLDVKMVPVDAKSATLIESIGYSEASRQLVIKFYHTPMLCFENVPNFRFHGLLNAHRKDAYYEAFIKDHFQAKEVVLPSSA